MIKETIIDGYHVSLDTDMEGHGEGHPDRVSGCWIEDRKTGASASLACLESMGWLSADSGDWPVPEATIDDIADWAESEGY